MAYEAILDLVNIECNPDVLYRLEFCDLNKTKPLQSLDFTIQCLFG